MALGTLQAEKADIMSLIRDVSHHDPLRAQGVPGASTSLFSQSQEIFSQDKDPTGREVNYKQIFFNNGSKWI